MFNKDFYPTPPASKAFHYLRTLKQNKKQQTTQRRSAGEKPKHYEIPMPLMPDGIHVDFDRWFRQSGYATTSNDYYSKPSAVRSYRIPKSAPKSKS